MDPSFLSVVKSVMDVVVLELYKIPGYLGPGCVKNLVSKFI